MVSIQHTVWSCKKESPAMGATPVFHMFRLVLNIFKRKLLVPRATESPQLLHEPASCQTSSRTIQCQTCTFWGIFQDTVFKYTEKWLHWAKRSCISLSFVKMRNLSPWNSCQIVLNLFCVDLVSQNSCLKKWHLMISSSKRRMREAFSPSFSLFYVNMLVCQCSTDFSMGQTTFTRHKVKSQPPQHPPPTTKVLSFVAWLTNTLLLLLLLKKPSFIKIGLL